MSNKATHKHHIHLFVTFSLLFACLTAVQSTYSTDSYSYDPKASGYEPKPRVEKPTTSKYEPESSIEKPKPFGYESKPSLEIPKEEEMKLYKKIGVQGIIYCDIGSKRIPLEGAVAELTCLSTEVDGYKYSPAIRVLSEVTDINGYFLATLDLAVQLKSKVKLSDCKVFLHKSLLESCKIPTDVNNGISGCLPSTFNLLTHNKMKLFSVGPFVYGSLPHSGSVPDSDNGGY